jgi:endo-1,4-beta-xylanase
VRITSLPALMLATIGVACACSESTGGTENTGGAGATASGGATGWGGSTVATGGTVDTGGTVGFGGTTTAVPTGGTQDTGGTTTAGGWVGTGGTTESGGTAGAGGMTMTGGTTATGGSTDTGGTTWGTGGDTATGGSTDTGGTTWGAGGNTATGGSTATGGTTWGAGGNTAMGGRTATGGTTSGTGGTTATGGSTATGGTTSGTGGNTAAGGGSEVDCSATMPTGGTDHCGANTQGNAGGLAWSLWSNALNSGSCITTYNTTAFSARWSNSGDFLARVGLEWGNGGKTYDQYGTIEAQFSYKKTGSGGGFSYIGIYGWTTNPCVEWYIVDDSFNNFPFNAYNATQKGTATIDGETYKLFQNRTNGTGGSRCSGVSQWDQFWSIRQKARQCGTISITQHFDAWTAAGLTLGGLLEAKILVEVGGGTGSIEFPVANVTAG